MCQNAKCLGFDQFKLIGWEQHLNIGKMCQI